MTKKNACFRLVVAGMAILSLAACGGDGGGDGGTQEPAAITKEATLTLGQEVPAPVAPPAAISGTMTATLTTATNAISGTLTLSGDFARVTAAHIHDGVVGVAGGVVVGLNNDGNGVWSVPANAPPLTAAQAALFKSGSYYVNVHTALNAPGEIRGQLIGFAENVQPIFSASCALGGCHVPGSLAPMSLRSGESVGSLVNQTAALGGVRVIPGDSANSILYKKISGTTAGAQMPVNSPPLAANEQNLIKVWIDMGAKNN